MTDKFPPLPPNVRDLWDWADKFSEVAHELAERRAAVISARRVAAQNDPLTKASKSRAIKAHYENVRAEAAEQKRIAEEQAERDRTRAWAFDGCQCAHTKHPPCYFCENATQEEFEAWEASRK